MSGPVQATWMVDSQLQRTTVNPSGQVEEGYTVNFHTGQGHYGSVFVPNTRYNADNVRAAVQAQANLLDEVGSLTEGGNVTA